MRYGLFGVIVIGRNGRAALRSLALLAALAGMVSGCKDKVTPPTSLGAFSGTLAGDRTGKKSGWATVLHTYTSSSIYGATTSDDFHVQFRVDGQPAVGTFQIGPAAGEFYSLIGFTDHAVVATSGSITITSVETTSSAELVKGSFDVTYADGDEEFTFVGTFDARACTSGCID